MNIYLVIIIICNLVIIIDVNLYDSIAIVNLLMKQMDNYLENIEIILVEPSHPGNIGATARAMKNMGLSHLCLVKPKKFPDAEAVARASGATDILDNVRVVASLDEALADKILVVATSARMRTLSWPIQTVREWTQSLAASPVAGKIGIMFGPERVGLNNEQLHQCHCHINIPANPEFSSLNLASAVQLVCYELRYAFENVSIDIDEPEVAKATAGELENYFKHLEQVLYTTGFINPRQPKQLMARLRRLFLRADLDIQEINILRGVLSSVELYRSTRED